MAQPAPELSRQGPSQAPLAPARRAMRARQPGALARGRAPPADRELARARMQAALLTSRTVAHHLRNQLTLTVGYCALLARNPALPPSLRGQALEALHGAQAAVAVVARLQRLRRLELDAGLCLAPEQAILDLDRSCEPPTDGLGV